ncbi:MAG: ester cyclase [Actinomycetota bacterium]|nr:ester cyclase [Actinomycetota bacterium]
MSDPNEASFYAAVAAFNDSSARERFLELYASDVVLHGYPRGIEGIGGAREFYSELWSAFPDARIQLDETLVSDDRLAARYTLSGGVQAQDFYGSSATGAATNIEGIVWLRFKDGYVVEVWQASGTLDTLTRLSARATKSLTRHSASADAAALRWEETHSEPDPS